MTSRRRRRANSPLTRLVWPILFLACLGAFAVARLIPGRGVPPAGLPPGAQSAIVSRVIDGDTVEVLLAGQSTRLRYIGIDAPEQDEPCAAEATAANDQLVAGQSVTLVKDVSETDRFGRLLRYVYVDDIFVNAELVAQGYARSVAFPPDTAQQETLNMLEAQARAAGLGCHAFGSFGALHEERKSEPSGGA